ncbi:hypothetical protein XENOCAPTIV_009548, partial [Xenoophorus captivus]
MGFSLIGAVPRGEISSCSWIIQLCCGSIMVNTAHGQLLCAALHKQSDGDRVVAAGMEVAA